MNHFNEKVAFTWSVADLLRGRTSPLSMAASYCRSRCSADNYLASLETEPGLIWRRCGEKIAFARVRRGEDDTSGRATLRFETLVAPSKQSSRIAESLAAVAVTHQPARLLLIRDGGLASVEESTENRLKNEMERHQGVLPETAIFAAGARGARTPRFWNSHVPRPRFSPLAGETPALPGAP